MYLIRHYSYILLTLIFSHSTLASEISYPIIKVPMTNDYYIVTSKYVTDNKNKMRVSLINTTENKMRNANDITYIVRDRNVVDEFFLIDNKNITLFILTKSSLDENYEFKGVTYHTFMYDIYDEYIDLITPPINDFMNCIDGIDLEKNISLNCQYKNKEQILNYFKNR